MKKMIALAATSLCLAVLPAAAQDVEAGKKVFKKCAACHSAEEAKNKVGPHLVNIIERPAGAVEDFKYSKALLKQAEGGLTWTEENIAEYLKKPSEMIKGTKMSFAGLKKDDEIANVIAYLKSTSSE